MQSFTGQSYQFMANHFSSYFFIHPAYLGQNLPYYSTNFPFQFQNKTENSMFQGLSTSFLPAALTPRSSSTERECQDADFTQKIVKRKSLKSEEQAFEEQQQFKIKLNKSGEGSSISYKKKNTESNIVNQSFSFLNSDRSKGSVSACFKNDVEKTEEYYKIMNKIKQASKKYINRKYLQRLLAFEPKSEFERAFNKAKPIYLTAEQMRKALRVLLFNFLREQVTQTLLTSCKIYKETLPEHFWRKREIMRFLFSSNKAESD